MRWITALRNRVPHRQALLHHLEGEFVKREILAFHESNLEFLREILLQYPKRERFKLAAALAELLKRVQDEGDLFVPRSQDGERGRKWSAGYSNAYILVEVGDWLNAVRDILAQRDNYRIKLEPGQAAVTVGADDFEDGMREGFELIETANIEKLPALRIVPISPEGSA